MAKSDESFEKRHNPANIRADIFEPGKYRRSLSRFSSGYRYAEHEISLHVHTRIWRNGNESESSYYCAIYERAGTALDFRETPSRGSPRSAKDGGIDQTQTAMLVDNVDLVHFPQIVSGDVLPSMVRLQPLYFCERFWIDSGKLVWMNAIPFDRVIEDWKRSSVLDERLGIYKEIGRVIESGPEHVDTFTNETRPSFIRRMFNDLGTPEVVALATPKVVLSEHSVRVALEENVLFKGELAEVFFGPLEFQSCAAERISHGVDNDRSAAFRKTLLGLKRRQARLATSLTAPSPLPLYRGPTEQSFAIRITQIPDCGYPW